VQEQLLTSWPNIGRNIFDRSSRHWLNKVSP